MPVQRCEDHEQAESVSHSHLCKSISFHLLLNVTAVRDLFPQSLLFFSLSKHRCSHCDASFRRHEKESLRWRLWCHVYVMGVNVQPFETTTLDHAWCKNSCVI